MEQIFASFETCCLIGHTHSPGIFTENLQFFAPDNVDCVYPLDGRFGEASATGR